MDMHDEIAKVAYELYEKKGRPDGSDLENWYAAERIVKAMNAEKKNTDKAEASAQSGKKAEVPWSKE